MACASFHVPVESPVEVSPTIQPQRPPYRLISILIALAAAIVVCLGVYWNCAKLVDGALRLGPYAGTSGVYSQSPEKLITNISGRSREKRRPLTFAEIPKALVNAVVSVEDKHFFRHEEIDPLRRMKGAYVDFRDAAYNQKEAVAQNNGGGDAISLGAKAHQGTSLRVLL
jgi:membrane peptidoglycan carboxypeptidase